MAGWSSAGALPVCGEASGEGTYQTAVSGGIAGVEASLSPGQWRIMCSLPGVGCCERRAKLGRQIKLDQQKPAQHKMVERRTFLEVAIVHDSTDDELEMRQESSRGRAKNTSALLARVI